VTIIIVFTDAIQNPVQTSPVTILLLRQCLWKESYALKSFDFAICLRRTSALPESLPTNPTYVPEIKSDSTESVISVGWPIVTWRKVNWQIEKSSLPLTLGFPKSFHQWASQVHLDRNKRAFSCFTKKSDLMIAIFFNLQKQSLIEIQHFEISTVILDRYAAPSYKPHLRNLSLKN